MSIKSLSSPPAPGQGGDAACPVAGLAASATTTCTFQVSYDATGTDVLWVQADALNTVAETNDGNNDAHSGIAVRKPDMRITGMTVASTGVAGQPVTIIVVAKNASAVDVIHSFDIDVYQNLGVVPVVGQPGDYTCTIPAGLAPRATAVCTASVTYSSAGTYQIRAQVDTQNSVDEIYENNNVYGPRSITITPAP